MSEDIIPPIFSPFHPLLQPMVENTCNVTGLAEVLLVDSYSIDQFRCNIIAASFWQNRVFEEACH